MASRYRNTEIRKEEDGRRVYRTRIPTEIPQKDTDMYVVTQLGDRLDLLADKYYNDPKLWWIIAYANNIHDAPIGLEEGQTLRIPTEFLNILSEF